MTKSIKESVKLTYTAAVKNGSGCGCGPSCCSPVQSASFLDENYKNVEGYQEIADFGLGCGLPTEIADIKKGNTVLDLGSGAGNDVFIARNQVGESGKVIGVDFTEAMVEKANDNKHFSISDVVLNSDLPKGILDAAEMYAGCVSGALVCSYNLSAKRNLKRIKRKIVQSSV